MSVAAVRTSSVRSQPTVGIWRIAQSAIAVSIGLYAFAFAVRLWAIGQITFPLSEGSAYYLSVARNLVAGRGLVIDSIWSYSTPPLILPRPAFELWQPMATFVAALPMVFNPGFGATQLGGVLLGSLLAPLAWLVARDTARRLDLPARRAWFVALGAGVLTAVAGPFLLATAVPDSTLPFAVFAVAACLLMPAAAAGKGRAMIGLGILLGLAYLTRLEAVWFGLAFALLVVASRTSWKMAAQQVAAVAAVAALVSVPWWLRNLSVFGSALPGQVADNIFLTRNEQIFWYAERPTLDGLLAQGMPQITANIGGALWHNMVNVLLVPAAPVVAVGLATVAFLLWKRRSTPATAHRGSLAAVLLAGSLTFAVTSILFPVATLWGTFEHASGPLLVGLAVAAVIGGDSFVAWLVRRRQWARQNAWMAPAALIALTFPLAALQLGSAARQAASSQRIMLQLPGTVMGALHDAGVRHGSPVITDRPIWLSDVLLMPTLALPDEPASSILALAEAFEARAVVVVDQRGRYPDALRAGPEATCFSELPNPASNSGDAAPAVFVIHSECAQ